MSNPRPAATVCVLVLPGGKPRSAARSRPWHLSNLRLAWLARSLRASLRPHGVDVERVRYRLRGWNEPDRDPVRDAAAAVDSAVDRLGAIPVVLVGHSMGGRVAAHVAAHRDIRAIAALAPWWPESDAELIPPECRLVVAHGTSDSWTDPVSSRAQAERAHGRGVDAAWLPQEGGGHFMLTRPRWWHEVAADLARAALPKQASCHG